MTDDRTQGRPRIMSRRARLVAAAIVAGAAVAVAASCMNRPTVDPAANGEPKGKQERLFRDWPKPDLVLLLSGQQHGYMLPCGCSRPQVGGLERRYNLIQGLIKRGWPVLSLDVGDIPQRKGPAGLPNVQGLLKYKYSMEALKRIGYSAVTFGEYEAALPLMEALAAFTLQNFDATTNKPLPPFVLAANMEDREKNFPEMMSSWKIAKAKNSDIKVAVVGTVGPSVAAKINDPAVKFPKGSVAKALVAALKEMEPEKPDVRVLLYQGQPEEARACAKAFPNRFQVILCISDFDEPPSEAEVVKDAGTLVVTVGHKGKYVGAIGVNHTGKADPKFELRYQLVRLGEEYLTPEGQEKGHPILELMEEYTRELKREDYLAKYLPSKHPLQVGQPADKKPTFVGSERCKKCHEHAYEVWQKVDKEGRSHSRAYQSLVEAKRPANRQYDGECIVCHTVGFGYESGYRNEKDTPKLLNVGCESCHGPASLHVKNPNNSELRSALNPWKSDVKRIEIDLCVKCHDTDNDVHWNYEKWKKIEHSNPRGE
jgi:hypothetical protein